ncbi:hypothetical protein [Salinifilum ghardaiensis]
MSSVDVHVKSEPSSCRELASWLRMLAANDRAAADAAFKSSSSSEGIWEGQAADAFRTQQYKAGRDIDELVEGIEWVVRGLEQFADDIDTVRAGMQQCVQMAHDAGLTVTGSVIHEPEDGSPTTGAPTGMGGDMPGLDPHSAERSALEEKHKAYQAILASVDDKRRLERTAHRSLADALDGGNSIVETVTANPQTWISRGLISAGTFRAAETGLAANAESMRNFADEFARLSADSTMPAEARNARMQTLLTNTGMEDQAATSNRRMLLGGSRTKAGAYVLDRLSANMGGQKSTRLAKVGKLFNVTAGLTAVGFTAQDIMNGEPIGKSVRVNMGGYAIGTAGGSAATWAATSGGALSVASAPVTALGLGVGFATATAYTYFQDHDLRDLGRDLGGDRGDGPNDNTDEYRKARIGR